MDFKYDVYYCSVCGTRNRLPKEYAKRMKGKHRRIPEEMQPTSSTMEYIMSAADPVNSPRRPAGEPYDYHRQTAFVFVLDVSGL